VRDDGCIDVAPAQPLLHFRLQLSQYRALICVITSVGRNGNGSAEGRRAEWCDEQQQEGWHKACGPFPWNGYQWVVCDSGYGVQVFPNHLWGGVLRAHAKAG
jgi:hypothetical protein